MADLSLGCFHLGTRRTLFIAKLLRPGEQSGVKRLYFPRICCDSGPFLFIEPFSERSAPQSKGKPSGERAALKGWM